MATYAPVTNRLAPLTFIRTAPPSRDLRVSTSNKIPKTGISVRGDLPSDL